MQIHNAVSVFIFTDDKNPRTLLVKHKKFGKWFQPGGHQEKYENILDGAIRETKEETGIDLSSILQKPEKISDEVLKLPIPDFVLIEKIPMYKNEPEHSHQDFIYVTRIPHQDVLLAESEHDDIGWFKKEDLKNLEMLENTKKLLLEVFESFDKS